MADDRASYKTWGHNRSVRLDGFNYGEHAPYHVTVCAVGNTRPFEDARLAEMVCETIRRVCDDCGAYLGAFCVMPDHLHLLLSPDRRGMILGDIVGRIKGATTRASWALGWQGKLWQGRFYDHIVRRSEGIASVGRYIYENPDRKELPGDYPYRFVDRDLE